MVADGACVAVHAFTAREQLVRAAVRSLAEVRSALVSVVAKLEVLALGEHGLVRLPVAIVVQPVA